MLLARKQASDLVKQRLIIKELVTVCLCQSHRTGGKGQAPRKVRLHWLLSQGLGGQVVLAEEPGITGSLGCTEGLGHSSTQAHMPPRKCHHLHLKQVCSLPTQNFVLRSRDRGEPKVPSLKLTLLSWTLRLLSNIPALHPQVASHIPPFLCQSKKQTNKQTNLYTLPRGFHRGQHCLHTHHTLHP